MPTVLRWRGYRFFFFSNESGEPAHVHVEKDELEAKFWLDPVSLARNRGFRQHEIGLLEGKVSEEAERFRTVWHDYFNTRR